MNFFRRLFMFTWPASVLGKAFLLVTRAMFLLPIANSFSGLKLQRRSSHGGLRPFLVTLPPTPTQARVCRHRPSPASSVHWQLAPSKSHIPKILEQGFSRSALLTSGLGHSFLWEDILGTMTHWNSVPGLYSLEASSTISPLIVMTTTNVSRHYQMSPGVGLEGGQNHP